jgi:capsular polysaccharide biosynthesis protein
VRVDEELNRHQITNVAVAQEASLVRKPVSPSKLLVVAMALALATVGTGVIVLGFEKMGSRVHSASQLENILRLPVLATVPEGRPFAAAAGR